MYSAVDAIYLSLWPGVTIKRHLPEHLDRLNGIDVLIKFPNGMILTAQEKALRFEYRACATVTVEFWNDPQTRQKPGDWFHEAAQLYFCGYATQDRRGLNPWILLNWPNVVLATHAGLICWRMRENSKTRAQANYKYAYMRDFPDFCVIASSGV